MRKNNSHPKKITYEDLNSVNNLLLQDTDALRIKAANLTLDYLGMAGKASNLKAADSILKQLLTGLLNGRDYMGVATLLWGKDVFDVRPRSVKMIFNGMMKGNKIAIMGGSSVSKTYSAGGWLLIDWLFWPEKTNIKLASVNEDHLRGNIFAHLVGLHQSSVIKLPGEVQSTYIGLDPKNRDFGISGVVYPAGTNSTGRLKGYKPKPLPNVHPVLGIKTTRLRVLMDEAQNSTEGVFKDFSSLFGSINGPESVKIALCMNPEDVGHTVGRLTRPKGGWDTFDLEEDEEWESEEGWSVIRIDPKKTENVVQKKIIFPNFQTYETFLGFQAKGDSSPDYYTFGRGAFPIKGTYNQVIQRYHLNRQQGTVRFIGDVIDVASVDVALVRDKLVFTKGRWGRANEVIMPSGTAVKFEDPAQAGRYVSKYCLQVEQQYDIPVMNDTVKTGNAIMEMCKKLGVQPKYLGVDSTGSGISIYHHLKNYFGDVLPLQWATEATERKILAEDESMPKELYDRLASEMWFATAMWLEHGIIYISYEVDESPLFEQLTDRRYNGKGTKGRQRVESKEDYKKRKTLSPDEADSLVMLQQVVRMRQGVTPGMFSESKQTVKVDLKEKYRCVQRPGNLSYAVELRRKDSQKAS